MSTLWTPGGEYTPRSERQQEPAATRPQAQPGPGEQPSPEELAAAQEQVRAVLEHPVVAHVAGHAMGLFELAALHLQREAATDGREKPDLDEAGLAIDAMANLIEGLGSRLGEYQGSLEQALSQLRLAYVQAKEG